MHIFHLSLTNFRNYPRLELELPARKLVLEADNAQGKTNLLEAIFFLATTRSPRATSERELIGWSGRDDFLPSAHLVAKVHRVSGEVKVEIILRAERVESPAAGEDSAAAQEAEEGPFPGLTGVRKQVRVNGLPRRASELVGQVKVVMFTATDINLVGGAPSLRRRYLDIALSQLDGRYLRSLQRYQRVLTQRNHLLRRLAAGQAQPQELDFWDRELVEDGSYITWRRYELLSALAPLAQELHAILTSGREKLGLRYRPSVGHRQEPGAQGWPKAFRQALEEMRAQELTQGLSLVGPHRDDLQFLANGVDMGIYGSRGQQRVVIQSLKLAEAQLMQQMAQDAPILLLDDVLSELDSQRQQQLLQAIDAYPQVFITTTAVEPFPRDFLNRAARYRIRQGTVNPVEG